MTRVLVTGGAGFISSNLCRHLLSATEHEVVIMDALTYAGNTANIADLLGHERLETTCRYYLGLLDERDLKRAHEKYLDRS